MDSTQRAAILKAYQAQTLMILALLNDYFPDDEHRPSIRAGCIQALGAVEEALQVERTFPRRDARRAERVRS